MNIAVRCAIIALATGAHFLSGGTTHAQTIAIPGDMCGKAAANSAEPLAGKWLAVNRDGGGAVGPFGFALKSRPTENLTLLHPSGGILTFTGKNDLGDQRLDMQPLPVAETLPDEFDVQLESGRIETVDVSALLPCAWSEMPGYKGHIDYPLQGQGEMRMTVMFNFPSQNAGFGLLHFTGNMMGNPIDVWRYVTLTRKNSKGMTLGCNPLEPVCRKAIACQEDEEGNKREPEICDAP